MPLHLLHFCIIIVLLFSDIVYPPAKTPSAAGNASDVPSRKGPTTTSNRQSRGTWPRRCWLRFETRTTAVTCYYGAPSISDLRPCAMTKATSCTLARCPPRTWKRQCQTPPSTRSCQASTPRHVTRSRGACACTGSPA